MDKLYVSGEVNKDSPALFLGSILQGNGMFVETFYDEECRNRQCHAARRTMDDLFILFKTYFPEITINDITKLLLTTRFIKTNAWQDEVTLEIRLTYCTDVNRFVARYYSSRSNVTMSFLESDQKMYANSATNKYGWLELINALNIYDESQLNELRRGINTINTVV